MGQQQLLLIVLGMMIVGVAIVFGNYIFKQQAINNKRDLVANETVNIGNLAQNYCKKPKQLGGGGGSFEGWQVPEALKVTPSGEYTAAINPDKVEIIGIGNEIVTGTDYVKVKTIVTVEDIFTEVLN